MACNGCPFNDGITEEATQAQNWGCLPTKEMMVERFDSHRQAHSCHDADNKPCRGLCAIRPAATNAPVIAYSKWYQEGYDALTAREPENTYRT